MSPTHKQRIAVVFGGASPEHDVSIVTGLQMIDALDSRRFTPVPVYMTPKGAFYIGEALRDEAFYVPSAQSLASCERVLFRDGGIASAVEPGDVTRIDAVLPALHGGAGEDGRLASLWSWAGVAFAGMRAGPAYLAMDKVKTKEWAAAHDIPVLPWATVRRPERGLIIAKDVLEDALEGFEFPVIVKPSHLGSSIGVAKADDLEQARAVLVPLFKLDDTAIIEPFVTPLVEYNIAVRRVGGRVVTSAVERPLSDTELLDFSQKYQAGGGGLKQSGMTQQGMLALTRRINPPMAGDAEATLRRHASTFFDSLDGSGAPRLDFISNGDTGEIWFNEVNPTPGSLGFFLWEAGDPPVLYPELLSDLIDEARQLAALRKSEPTAPPEDARLFPRR